MGVKLIVVSGKSAGKGIGLKQGKLLIGRADECDVRPLGEEVSRRHCLLEAEGDSLAVKDLDSRNGTFVNGSRIAERLTLADGDIVRVGPLELRVSCDRPVAARPSVDGDDVSRWLMADDDPAGISDTTRTIRVVGANEEVPGTEEPTDESGGSAPAPAADPVVAEAADKSSSGAVSAIESLLASKSKPGALPAGAKSEKSETSREAAAEALKKFFGKK
jgi:pSer/pThr/pTyr-binding forkhead associated (FHA) protein